MNNGIISYKKNYFYNLFNVLSVTVCTFFAFVNLKWMEISRISSIITGMIACAFFGIVLYIVLKKKEFICRHWLVFVSAVLALTFGLRIIFALVIQTQPVSDFNFLYQCALKYLSDGKEIYHDYYFKMYPFTILYSLYDALLIKVFGGSLFAMKVINILFMTGTNLLIILTTEKVLNKPAAVFAGILYAVFPEIIFMSTVFTNQIPATFFFYLSIYLIIISKGRWQFYLFSGISLVISNLFRPEAIILVTTIIVAAINAIVEMKLNKEKLLSIVKHTLKSAGIVILTYVILQSSASYLLKALDVSENGLKSGVNSWKFMCGLNVWSYGGFVEPVNFPDFFSTTDIEERKEIGSTYIKKNIKELFGTGKPLYFFLDKSERLWSGSLYATKWSCDGVDTGRVIKGGYTVGELFSNISTFNYIETLMIWAFAATGLIIMFKNKEKRDGLFLLSTLVLVNFGVYCLIEYQQRYRFNTLPCAIILAGLFIYFLSSGKKHPAGKKDVQ